MRKKSKIIFQCSVVAWMLLGMKVISFAETINLAKYAKEHPNNLRFVADISLESTYVTQGLFVDRRWGNTKIYTVQSIKSKEEKYKDKKIDCLFSQTKFKTANKNDLEKTYIFPSLGHSFDLSLDPITKKFWTSITGFAKTDIPMDDTNIDFFKQGFADFDGYGNLNKYKFNEINNKVYTGMTIGLTGKMIVSRVGMYNGKEAMFKYTFYNPRDIRDGKSLMNYNDTIDLTKFLESQSNEIGDAYRTLQGIALDDSDINNPILYLLHGSAVASDANVLIGLPLATDMTTGFHIPKYDQATIYKFEIDSQLANITSEGKYDSTILPNYTAKIEPEALSLSKNENGDTLIYFTISFNDNDPKIDNLPQITKLYSIEPVENSYLSMCTINPATGKIYNLVINNELKSEIMYERNWAKNINYLESFNLKPGGLQSNYNNRPYVFACDNMTDNSRQKAFIFPINPDDTFDYPAANFELEQKYNQFESFIFKKENYLLSYNSNNKSLNSDNGLVKIYRLNSEINSMGREIINREEVYSDKWMEEETTWSNIKVFNYQNNSYLLRTNIDGLYEILKIESTGNSLILKKVFQRNFQEKYNIIDIIFYQKNYFIISYNSNTGSISGRKITFIHRNPNIGRKRFNGIITSNFEIMKFFTKEKNNYLFFQRPSDGLTNLFTIGGDELFESLKNNNYLYSEYQESGHNSLEFINNYPNLN